MHQAARLFVRPVGRLMERATALSLPKHLDGTDLPFFQLHCSYRFHLLPFWVRETISLGKVRGPTSGGRRTVLRGFGGVKKICRVRTSLPYGVRACIWIRRAKSLFRNILRISPYS